MKHSQTNLWLSLIYANINLIFLLAITIQYSYSNSTLAIVSRQEDGMVLPIDELSPKVMRSKEGSHAPPARRDHPGLGAFCPIVFAPRLAPCPSLLVGAMRAPGARTVTAALRVMGLAAERHFTNYHRVLNRATWSARQGSQIVLGLWITFLVPPGATMVLGADDTVERRSGRKITAKGCYRDAVRSSHKHVRRCVGLTWVALMRLVPVPWSRRVGARPFLTALCWPTEPPSDDGPKPASMGAADDETGPPLAAGAPVGLGRRWGLCGRGACLGLRQTQVAMVSRLRWDAALYHQPAPQPPGKRGRKPLTGQRQRSLQGWAKRADTPWETVEVEWYRGERKTLWVFSRTALWYTPGVPPVAIRYGVVADPEGTLRMEAFFCTDLQATPVAILPWVVRRWSVEVTFEEARAHLGLETQRPWSDQAIARTTPILLALFSLVTVLACG